MTEKAERPPIKDTQMSFYLPRELKEKAEQVAWERHISLSEFIRELIYAEVEK
jgi:predicted DNA-binding protein